LTQQSNSGRFGTAKDPERKENQMNPVQAVETENKVVNPFTSKVSTKVDNILTGQKIALEADMIVPQITDDESLASIVPVKEDIYFWLNWAFRIAARNQVMAMLEFDLGNDALNDLYDAFKVAIANILDPKATQEERSDLIALLLKQKKFAELAGHIEGFKAEKLVVDFTSTHKLEKPSSKRGRKAKAVANDGTDSASE
jgi:hypothetical protein